MGKARKQKRKEWGGVDAGEERTPIVQPASADAYEIPMPKTPQPLPPQVADMWTLPPDYLRVTGSQRNKTRSSCTGPVLPGDGCVLPTCCVVCQRHTIPFRSHPSSSLLVVGPPYFTRYGHHIFTHSHATPGNQPADLTHDATTLVRLNSSHLFLI